MDATGQVQTATYTTAVNVADWPITTTDVLSTGPVQVGVALGTYDHSNQNSVSYGTGAGGPISDTKSGGRALSLLYSSGLLSDVQSPLWRSSGGAQGQHVTYGYNGSGQLTTLTRAAGTTDALTTPFGYNGTQLISVTTPYTAARRTWTLGYDAAGRLVSITSPISGGAQHLHQPQTSCTAYAGVHCGLDAVTLAHGAMVW